MAYVVPPELAISNQKTYLKAIIEKNSNTDQLQWLDSRLELIIGNASARDLFLTFSIAPSLFDAPNKIIYPKVTEGNKVLYYYLMQHKASLLDVVRIYVLVAALDKNTIFFSKKILQLLETSDRTELAVILKYLIFFPHAATYKLKAVDAVRTNITEVFDAIALNNPYPAAFFDEQQWNQLYIKAAFLQRPLSQIMYVDERANNELTRMINDLAKERWSAGREIDPLIWRPVSYSMDTVTLENIKYLLASKDLGQKYAGVLSCFHSNSVEAHNLLDEFDSLKKSVQSGEINWKCLEQMSREGRT